MARALFTKVVSLRAVLFRYSNLGSNTAGQVSQPAFLKVTGRDGVGARSPCRCRDVAARGPVPGRSGEGSGPSPRGRMSGWGPGKGTGGPVRGSNWRGRGPVPGAAVGRVPGADAGRGRGVVHGPECWPVADVGRGALRIPGGAAARSLAGAARPSKWVFGSSYTRRQSTRSLVGNRCGSLPTPSRGIHPARQMHHAACIMQHDACSVQHAPCNGKQQNDDSLKGSTSC